MSNLFDNKSYSIPIFSSSQFVYNYTTVKKYGCNYLKLCTMNVQRCPNTEHPDKDLYDYNRFWEQYNRHNNFTIEKDPFTGKFDKVFGSEEFERLEKKALERFENRQGENKKMIESLIRSKRMVFEYAFSNDWDYFATFTIDPQKFDRYDLNEYHKKFSQWLRDYFRKKFGENIQYLCIPEMHKDGAWHEHALISGISEHHLKLFQKDANLPKYIKDKLNRNEKIYNCPAYQKKFGFCTFEPVRNSEACAKYITKYITKDMQKSVTDYGAKIYYVSRGVNKAEILKRGYYQGSYVPDFVNDYCSQATFAYSDDFAKILVTKFNVKNDK